MNAFSILISFTGWILVSIVFECLYALVSRIAVCRIAKHSLCEGYWGFASISVFLALNWHPSVHELFMAMIVCGIHCVLTDQFSRIRFVNHPPFDSTDNKTGEKNKFLHIHSAHSQPKSDSTSKDRGIRQSLE